MIYSMFAFLDRTCYCASKNLHPHPKLQRRIGVHQYAFKTLKDEEYEKIITCLNSHIKLMEYAKKVCDDAEDFTNNFDRIEGKGYEHYANAFKEFNNEFEALINKAYTTASIYLRAVTKAEED